MYLLIYDLVMCILIVFGGKYFISVILFMLVLDC